MMKQRKIELLAPAKNLECGIEAVNHGADAVYIGAPKFGARAAAVNSLEDIAALVAYAHLYNVRIYVTVNTILKEEELAETEKMIWELYRIGVDALIVQDMGITRLNLPSIPLHGSTQMDNRTPEKVRFLADAGFRQVVLARELSLQEIRRIHETCPETPLEVFVHGALCVKLQRAVLRQSGMFRQERQPGRVCPVLPPAVQPVDADGKTIVRDKHLLSLKDLNQSEVLEDLLDAGASSLKIEGRLKDVSYVKNVSAPTAASWMPFSPVARSTYVLLRVLAVSTSRPGWTRVSAAASPITSCRAATGKSPLSIRRSLWARRWVR